MIWLRRLLCLPVVLFSYAVVVFIRLAWGADLHWESDVLVTTLRPDSWPARTWFKRWGAATFGHGVLMSHVAGDDVFKHELVHVEQIEANTLAGLVIALGLIWAHPLSLLAWPLTPALCYLCASLIALMRGKNGYRGNHLEQAAYDHEGKA